MSSERENVVNQSRNEKSYQPPRPFFDDAREEQCQPFLISFRSFDLEERCIDALATRQRINVPIISATRFPTREGRAPRLGTCGRTCFESQLRTLHASHGKQRLRLSERQAQPTKPRQETYAPTVATTTAKIRESALLLAESLRAA